MSLRFRPLVQVELLHDYFSDGKCEGLRAVPSPHTEAVLNRAGILWRMIGHKLVLVAKVTGAKLRTPLPPGTLFRFYLLPTSQSFFAFSNLGFDASGTHRYFFSNRSGVAAGTGLHLSQPAKEYSGTTAYAPGDLVRSGTDLYEAIRPSGDSLPAKGVGEEAWWMKKEPGQYANSADLMEWTGSFYSFPLSAPSQSVTAAVWGLNAASGVFDVPVRSAASTDFGEPQSAARFSLAGLHPGRYRLEANGESHVVYYDEEAVARKVFAVVEILADLPASHTHRLFEAGGNLVEPAPLYSLRIPARRVHWKYIARTADVVGIKDLAEDEETRLEFVAGDALQFLSTKPVPLRETPVATLALQSTQLGDVTPIASASPHGLSLCTVDTDVIPCAEIRLNL